MFSAPYMVICSTAENWLLTYSRIHCLAIRIKTEKCKDHIVCSWGYHHEFGNGDAGRGRQDWNRYCQDVIHGVAKFLLSWRLDVVAFSRSGIGIKDVLSKPWCAIFVYPRSNIRYWTYYMLHYICKLQMIKATELNNVLRPDELPKLPVYVCTWDKTNHNRRMTACSRWSSEIKIETNTDVTVVRPFVWLVTT